MSVDRLAKKLLRETAALLMWTSIWHLSLAGMASGMGDDQLQK